MKTKGKLEPFFNSTKTAEYYHQSYHELLNKLKLSDSFFQLYYRPYTEKGFKRVMREIYNLF